MHKRRIDLQVDDNTSSTEGVPGWTICPDSLSTGYRENGLYRIFQPDGSFSLFVDDEELATDDGSWIWSPGYYAGNVRAELVDARGQVIAEYRLDVTPHPDKTGQQVFKEMIAEIWAFDPSLVLGTEPAAIAVGNEGEYIDPWLQYARFRAYGRQFVVAMSAISSRPLRQLRSSRRLVPMQFVRRADKRTAFAALQSSETAAVLCGSAGSVLPQGALPIFDVPVVRETVDCPANRAIASALKSVLRQAHRLERQLQQVVEREQVSDTRSPLASRWPRRRDFLRSMQVDLAGVRRRPPYSEVAREEITVAGLNAISADPSYSRAYGLGWKLRRSGVEGPPTDEELWTSPTWEIYERWCFVALASALQQQYPDMDWKRTTSHKSLSSYAVEATNTEGVKLALLYQPRMPSGDARERAGFRSISLTREPDIVLVMEDRDHKRWVVFDAKYQSSRRSLLQSMTSAHIYRDSLRYQGKTPVGSYLIAPEVKDDVSWLSDADYMAAHGVGVLALQSCDQASGIIDQAINLLDAGKH